MRKARVFKALLGVEHTVIEDVDLEVDGKGREVLVARVRPARSRRNRCSRCARRCPGYDQGSGRRRWRCLDVGTVPAYLEADAARVNCGEHGVVVAAVPWARAGARCTTAFEDTCAWLVGHTAVSVVAVLMRVTWRTVREIVTRVVADLAGGVDRLDGLRRIGIDEIAYRKGHRYLTIVVDHDTGALVWAGKGRDKDTLRRFFDALGAERASLLTHVSADAAEWIATVVAERAPQAVLCLDPFHVVQWATDALDKVRRGLWNELRRTGRSEQAKTLKGSRWALIRNPDDLSPQQRAGLAGVQKTNRRLYTAYLLKEQLREVFEVKGEQGRRLLHRWLAWARRCRIPEFVKLAASITRHLTGIGNTLNCGLSNARVEATNTHLRVVHGRGYGYHTPDSFIAMAMLTRGAVRPQLPGRTA